MNFSFLSKYGSLFLEGTSVTVIISLVALLFGCIIGMLICLMKLSTFKVLKAVATTYIEILRGTPLFVQIYIIYFGLPQVGIDFPSILGISSDFIAGAFALSINSGAYVAEILRSGIQSVEKGQMEASRSLGLGYAATMRYVIVPQAIKNILPSLANEFITLVKESAIISVIGVREIMFTSSIVKNATYKPLEPLIVAAIIYFILTFTLSKLVGKFEKKLAKANA
ncbi:amino acid ABC transporter permease [Romboutsia sp. 1001713B170207_170306_H8]|uniref:amino acid ABC transporter permease n=1 Tax=Romboutsia sp. 1001713B170207_170306_H8 TaxID=2787112 RepID=UPI00189BF6D3|nr:amino acid ABC transporter permease [Romboutsia sp. 1001713B170207_170306_H8]